MSHPLDKHVEALMKAAADGPEATEDWIRDLQQEVGAPDGDDLPRYVELEYEDGTKETVDTSLLGVLAGFGNVPKFYSHDNPAPQDVIDSWSKDEDE